VICPKCGGSCYREEADVEVGIIYGPYGCCNCGWSEDSTYDCSAEWSRGERKRDPENPEFVVDPLGGMRRVKGRDL